MPAAKIGHRAIACMSEIDLTWPIIAYTHGVYSEFLHIRWLALVCEFVGWYITLADLAVHQMSGHP